MSERGKRLARGSAGARASRWSRGSCSIAFRVAYILGTERRAIWSRAPRRSTGDGIAMAAYALALLGTLELARRSPVGSSLGSEDRRAAAFGLGLRSSVVGTAA